MEYCISEERIIKIADIRWERIFLHISLYLEENFDKHTEICLEKGRREKYEADGNTVEYRHVVKEIIPLQITSFEGRTCQITLNMATVNSGNFLDNGQWRIVAKKGDNIFFAEAELQLAQRMEELDKIYKYGRKKYAYNVSFAIPAESKFLDMVMCSFFMKRNDDWQKRKHVWEAKTFKGKKKKIRKKIKINVIKLIYQAMSLLFRDKENRILFISETKTYMSGNLKFIYDRVVERKLDERFALFVSCRRAVGQRSSDYSWLKQIIMIAKCGYIFVDDYAPILGYIAPLRKSTLVQVWHAGEGFKSVGYSRFGKPGSPFPSNNSHKTYDYAITGSERLRDVYSEVFGIEREKIIPSGMPRLDGFLDEERIHTFRETFYGEYPEFADKKIILFAPTFRGTGQKTATYAFNMINLDRINEFCGEEYVFMIKLHPFITERFDIKEEYKDRIVDFSDYKDINSLYYVSDILITDYSSNFYEYALMRRPILFYTYDRELYEVLRGVHRPVKENAPGKVCDSFDELMTALENRDYEFEKTQRFFEDNFNNIQNNACDAVIDKILLQGEE